jgi:hypothetical protein
MVKNLSPVPTFDGLNFLVRIYQLINFYFIFKAYSDGISSHP